MNKYDENDIVVLIFYYLTISFIVGYAIGLLVVGKYVGLLLLSIAIIFGYLYGKEEYEYYILCKNNKDNNCVDDYNTTGNIGQTRIIEPPKNRPKKCKNYTYYTNGTHRDNKSFTHKFEKALEETLGGKFDKNGVFRK